MRTTTLASLAARARALVETDRRAVLGIVGAPGAGKSTLARALIGELAATPPQGLEPYTWVAHVPMDGFHLADVELARLGLLEEKGSPATFDAAGYAALLERVRADGPDTVYAPQFERDLEQPVAGAIPVCPATRLVVTEGNYLLLDAHPWEEVAARLDETWFCDVDEDRRISQLVSRHARYGKSHEAALQWATGPDERNARLVRDSRVRATLVVPDSVLRSLEGS